jgi:hypothetical protein
MGIQFSLSDPSVSVFPQKIRAGSKQLDERGILSSSNRAVKEVLTASVGLFLSAKLPAISIGSSSSFEP